MRFGFNVFNVDPAEFLDIARTCDDLLWDHIAFGDAPFFPEVVSARFDYTDSEKRFWRLDMPVLDPWVAITHMATVTRRVRFMTSVLRMSVRKPLLEAKAACSVAAISGDRLAIGVGLAWMPEEFRYLHEDKKTRGARVDEAIQILRLCMGGGFVEFHGKYYDFDRLIMEPHPEKRIPIYVGGMTDAARRRAARYGDGWLGVSHTVEELGKIIPELTRMRREFGREKEPFDILLHCPDATTVDDIRRIEDLGVTDLWIQPWVDPNALARTDVTSMMAVQCSLQTKLDALKRYSDQVIARCQ